VEEYAVPLDGALPFLDWAEHQAFELAILSNDSADLFRARIRALGSTRNFTVCVVSALARYAKPDPAVYQLLLGRLGVSAPDCLFVDDRDENVRAARELGMGARVFTGFEALRASLGSTVAGDHKS
jgi:HAD superfamily hydrolase (TIGR01509 family)